jgi:hypothetical protein
MVLDATARRRWFGAMVLALALGMLLAGDSVLKGSQNPFLFLAYWLVCFVLTGVAVLVAFRDVRALHERTRLENRELLESTLKEIETEAHEKAREPSRREPGS